MQPHFYQFTLHNGKKILVNTNDVNYAREALTSDLVVAASPSVGMDVNAKTIIFTGGLRLFVVESYEEVVRALSPRHRYTETAPGGRLPEKR